MSEAARSQLGVQRPDSRFSPQVSRRRHALRRWQVAAVQSSPARGDEAEAQGRPVPAPVECDERCVGVALADIRGAGAAPFSLFSENVSPGLDCY